MEDTIIKEELEVSITEAELSIERADKVFKNAHNDIDVDIVIKDLVEMVNTAGLVNEEHILSAIAKEMLTKMYFEDKLLDGVELMIFKSMSYGKMVEEYEDYTKEFSFIDYIPGQQRFGISVERFKTGGQVMLMLNDTPIEGCPVLFSSEFKKEIFVMEDLVFLRDHETGTDTIVYQNSLLNHFDSKEGGQNE